MELVKLFRLPALALVLLLAAWPFPRLGDAASLLDSLDEANRVVAAYNAKIQYTEREVQYQIRQMDNPTPDADPNAIPANKKVREYFGDILEELARMKADAADLGRIGERMYLSLDGYTQTKNPEYLKEAQGLAAELNAKKQEIDERLTAIKNWCSNIRKIRSDADEKEWNKPDGKYKNERDALDNIWNLLMDRPPVPDVVGMKAKDACDLISGMGLKPEITALTEKPPEGKEYTVKSQDPPPRTLAKPGDPVTIVVYRQVVPNVVGLRLPQAVAVLDKARLKVGGVVMERAYSPNVSEKVTKQDPEPGEILPKNRSVKLWHYLPYGGGPTPQAPGGKPQGFQKGDAGRVDPRFRSCAESIAPDASWINMSCSEDKSGGISQLTWFIKKFASTEEAGNHILASRQGGPPVNQIRNYGESVGKGYKRSSTEYLWHGTSRYFDGTANTTYYHDILYRDVFLISYTEVTKKFDDDAIARWEPVYANSQKLIDERFPPTIPIASLGYSSGSAETGD